MEPVTREFKDLLFLSYVDDTYILGPAARILEAFGVLRERLEWVGLEVQAHKCRFWEREGKEVERALPLGMQRVDEGLTVVGVPIGEEVWEDPDRSRRARMQLHLPVRLGGFGIRAAASLSPLSYVCGWAQAARVIAQLGVAGEEAMFAEYLTTSTGAEFLDPWFVKALEQLPATIRHEIPGLPLHQHGPSRVHDEVKFAVAKISKASGGVVTLEDSVVLQRKRVAVAVRRPMAGEAHALEISVADPLSLSPSLLGQCGRQIGVAAREWERRKTSDYAPLLARNRGVQFTPLIVETWGCLGGRFERWLRQQGDAHVELAVSRGACREDDSVFSAYLLGSLKALIGVALQRAQARVILLRAASSMGGINVDLADRERDDVDVEGGALWVEAPYMSPATSAQFLGRSSVDAHSSAQANPAEMVAEAEALDGSGTATSPITTNGADFAEMRRRVGATSPDILHEIDGWDEPRRVEAYRVIGEMEAEAKRRLQIMPGG
ncbi:unnamed protein product [Closterium sp. NIES-65]|nr:unnamed protein product [Closterium sp. NIES-65]